MADLWPWFAVAAAGALHGINPASGWPAAVWLLRTRGRRHFGVLWPIATGHVASMSLVAGSIAVGAAIDRTWAQVAAAVLLVAIAARHSVGRPCMRSGGPAGLTLWSFLVSTGHGAGLMLVPSLLPLCDSSQPLPAFAGPLSTALAMVAVHTASMWLAGGVAAMLVARAWRLIAARRLASPGVLRPTPRRS